MDEKQVLALDYRQPLDGVPDEILAILPLFDGRRTIAQVIQQSRLPKPLAIELVQRLRRAEIICEPVFEFDSLAPSLDDWLAQKPKSSGHRVPIAIVIAVAAAAVALFLLVKPKQPIAPVAAVAVAPVAPPADVTAPQLPVAVPEKQEPLKAIEAPKVEVAKVEPPKVEVAKAEPPKVEVAKAEPPKVEVAKAEPPKAVEAPKAAPVESYESLVAAAKKHLDQGKMGKALDESRRALLLNDRGADAYLVIGTVQQSNGKNADAKAAFKKYLELSPKGQFAGEIRSILKSL